MKSGKRLQEWIFSVPEGGRSASDIIRWWELRRIPYNLLVGITGLCSLLLFYFFISRTNALKPGEDAIEPMALVAAPVIMNLCYTAGWIVEVFLGKPQSEDGRVLGPRLLKVGLKSSLVVVALPTAFWAGYWLLQVVGLIK
jgi:NADH:ubiquinone oxidoreductase subunit 5 (subunit L)/multisubunit Na+/H+ antiporter MnhA subunit